MSSPLSISDRTTLINDLYQQVDRLKLTETGTFRAVTLRGFKLKSGPNGTVQNQPITTTATVRTDHLIVVHARSTVHVNAELQDHSGRCMLLFSFEHDRAGTDETHLLNLLASIRADTFQEPAAHAPKKPGATSRTEKARQTKAAKREERLRALQEQQTSTGHPTAPRTSEPAHSVTSNRLDRQATQILTPLDLSTDRTGMTLKDSPARFRAGASDSFSEDLPDLPHLPEQTLGALPDLETVDQATQPPGLHVTALSTPPTPLFDHPGDVHDENEDDMPF